jgi:hypothetical protein
MRTCARQSNYLQLISRFVVARSARLFSLPLSAALKAVLLLRVEHHFCTLFTLTALALGALLKRERKEESV